MENIKVEPEDHCDFSTIEVDEEEIIEEYFIVVKKVKEIVPGQKRRSVPDDTGKMVDNKEYLENDGYNNGNYDSSQQSLCNINIINSTPETFNCLENMINGGSQDFTLPSLQMDNQQGLSHMLFSQQGAEVMATIDYPIKQEEQPEPEHWNIFPNITEFPGECDFDVDFSPHNNSNWTCSSDLKKLFIKINTCLNLNVKYSYQALGGTKMFLRVMIVYPDFRYIPVIRCNNHKVQNSNEEPGTESHIIRCPHNNMEYVGTDIGNVFSKRLALRFPLSINNVENNLVQNTIELLFTCQNSCPTGINRRATVLLFTLEDERGNMYGQKPINFKVCTVPKRDCVNEEKQPQKKRKSAANGPSSSKKPCRLLAQTENGGATGKSMNQQDTEQTSVVAGEGQVQVERVSSQSDILSSGCQVNVTMPDVSMAKDLLQLARDQIVLKMYDEPQNTARYMSFLNNIKTSQRK
ncbi:hypothetical protein DMENIID0001_148070 [Sergentomyia squamirostris]